jgi:hypothetical protein
MNMDIMNVKKHAFLTSTQVGVVWSSSHPCRFVSRRKRPRYSCKEVGWATESVLTLWRRKKFCSFRDPNPGYPTSISYFNWAIPAFSTSDRANRPPLWSSSQSSLLQIQRPGFDFRRYQIFWEVVSLDRGPPSLVSKTTEELLVRKSSGSGLESRDYGFKGSSALTTRHTSIRINLALTSPTSGGCAVGIVLSRTQATEFSLDRANNIVIKYSEVPYSEFLSNVHIYMQVCKHCLPHSLLEHISLHCLTLPVFVSTPSQAPVIYRVGLTHLACQV